jgi:hypothetical protein
MEQVNRMISKQKKSDLRTQIEETSVHSGIFREGVNNRAPRNRSKDKATSENMRDGVDTRHIEESRSIANYGHIKPSHDNSIHDKLTWEKFGDHSLSSRNGIRGRSRNAQNLNNLDHDQDQLHGYNDFGFVAGAPVRRNKGTDGNHHQADFGDMEKGEAAGNQEFEAMYREMAGS